MRPKRVGLTGGIGAGKSTVAELFVIRGAALIDADALAREATRDPEVLQRIAEELGEELVRDGALDRAATAARVFADSAARTMLNRIVHPWVRVHSDARVEELSKQSDPPPVILLDIPLLYENELETGLDAVVVVDAPLSVRAARVATRSGLREEEVRARDRAQMPLEEKVARAHFIIDNSGPLESLPPQIERVWQMLLDLPIVGDGA